MRRKIMVLFDPETEYAVRFMEYISRKGSIPLEIHVFTDFDRVKAYIMGGRAEILLVSERVMSDEISPVFERRCAGSHGLLRICRRTGESADGG